jgi:hypothetical protein
VSAFYSDITSIATNIETACRPIRDDLMDQQSQYLVEYPTSRFLGTMCWAGKKRIEETLEGLERIANLLAAKQRRSTGSEVQTVEIERLIDSIEGREVQLEVAQAMNEAALDAYQAMTGNAYGPVKGNNTQADTETGRRANELAAKYAKPEEPTVGTADNRPAKYSGPDGDFILGTDGEYHKVA